MKQKKQKVTDKKPYPEPMEGVTYREVMHMDMEELLSMLPKYKESDIKYLISKRVIRCFPIKTLDYEVLKRLHNVWGTESLVQVNARHLKRSEREAVLNKINKGINTKLEAWLHTKIEKIIEMGVKRINRKNIKIEAIKRFKLKNSSQTNRELSNLIIRTIRKVTKKMNKVGNDNKNVNKVGNDK